jgi:CubicO group peptidase (beta-lactamase class C family)
MHTPPQFFFDGPQPGAHAIPPRRSLLGQALSNRAGVSYERLLYKEIVTPLGLKDTNITLTSSQQTRLIQGHTATYQKARPWDEDALAGAGAIRSTADDMLTYLEANLSSRKALCRQCQCRRANVVECHQAVP